ncbi:MAG: ABC transporter substrate-binding protein [Caldilineaceae bacterium]
MITIDSTYDDPATEPAVEHYVLVQCGTPVPDELAAAEDTLVIEVPTRRLIEAGGGVLGAIEMLDLLEPLVAWRDQYTTGVAYLPKISAKYAAGELGDIGEYGSGWEATIEFEPDLFIAYDDRTTIEEARGLGIPYVFFSPFSEGPLGSAEQLKFVALFFNVEAKANELFTPIAEEYLRLRDLAQAEPEKPTVLLGHLNGQGGFNTRSYNRLESILIEDAGGVRVLTDELFDYSGFFPSVSVEVALEAGADADYWFSMAYLPTEATAADFIATDPINGEFQALRAGNMFHRFGRDEDYFRTPAIRVDELLADIVSILHLDLLPDHELIHLERVPGEE